MMGTLKLERMFKEIFMFLSHFKLKYKSVISLYIKGIELPKAGISSKFEVVLVHSKLCAS